MVGFVDREEQLDWMERNHKQKTSFLVLYGRRRVGKTELIHQFLKDKKHLFFLASEKTEERNRKDLQSRMADYLQNPTFEKIEFDSWEELFQEFIKRTDEKLVIAIDEFPYLIKQNKAIPSIFQKIWDQTLKDQELMLILCGSSISMMESQVLGSKSPLYGRRTGQWNLEPFQFKQLEQFFPDTSFAERLKIYSYVDGIPQYLNEFNPDKTPEWNLKNRILRKGEYLYEEAEHLLRQEFRKPAKYFTILQAIAEGNRRFGDICNTAQMDKPAVSQYLNKLVNLHIVSKKHPVTQKKKTRNSHYIISDNYYDLWFKIVYPRRSMIEDGQVDTLLNNSRKKLKQHHSFAFEDICRQVLKETLEGYKIGKWWRNGREIDIAALNRHKNKLLLGECKWKNQEIGQRTLHNLEKDAEQVRWSKKDRKETYALFSRSGFTENLKKLSQERNDLKLWTPADISEHLKPL